MNDRDTTSSIDEPEEQMEPKATEDGSEDAVEPGDDDAADPEGDRVAALEAEIADLRDQLLRKQADLVNFRRRTERERQARAEQARAELLQELLPVIDDFERALDAESDDIDAYRQGVEMIFGGLQETLRRLGVERIEPAGEPFDPNHHEAVEQTETDQVPAGHVVAVYKPGYRMGDRLLRAAMVGVATAPADFDDD